MSEVKKLPLAALEAMWEAVGSKPNHIPADSKVEFGVRTLRFEEYIYEDNGQGGERKKLLADGKPARRIVNIEFVK